MKNRIFPILLLVGLLFGVAVALHAQNASKSTKEQKSERVDLKPRMLVSKKLDRVEDGPNGKTYVYKYRVEAEPTEKDMPKYTVDPLYNITYEQKDFQKNDTVTLLSDNPESATDSPVWLYEVSYQGSGERKITFATTASVFAPTFLAANGETEEPFEGHCGLCRHEEAWQCAAANCTCRCCVSDDENCNCLGCQYQSPRCFSCPVGCTCDHCICSCDGCITQNPRCLSCPVGCTCDHCRCKCEESIDHVGRCGCTACKQKPLTCPCECHRTCP